jgi:cobalt-zinc-cadmium efflux system outer membrane protein
VLAGLAVLLGVASAARTAEPPVLSLPDAVRWALERNPELATLRQQHGIAAAGVVIARTYPFNPQLQALVMGATGQAVFNPVFVEPTLRLELEVRGQGRHRRAMAEAALSRTDWEIATQETLMAVRAIRAFNALLYRREKLHLADQAVQLQEEAATLAGRQVEKGLRGRGDLFLARADAAEAHALRGPARTAFDLAATDLRRVLGAVDEPLDAQGSLETATARPDPTVLEQAALQRRPELHALQLAVQEAEARLRLEIANRCPNPALGPAFENNETSDQFYGITLAWYIPVFNKRRGEILQRQAERARAASALEQAEVTVRMDVRTALARLADAEAVIQTYRTETLPSIRTAREVIDRLFLAGDPGVDVLRLLDIRRRFLRANDAYLDALFELSQARADLAAALADPSLAFPAEPCIWHSAKELPPAERHR